MSRRVVRREVERLEALIEDRTAKPAHAPVPPPPSAPKPSEPEKIEEVTPETILILSAAVAAFLGKRARIRSARLVRAAPSSAWAQQGRVFVQASHNLGVMHGR
jgi:methylmalonyl-CoA carboxyltransferase large subunit